MIKYYWRSGAWAIFIAYALFSSGNNLPENKLFHFPHFDKLVHFGLFFVLEWLLLFDAQKKDNKSRRVKAFLTLIIVLYAGITELLQLFVFTVRDGDAYDFLADLLGTLSALAIFNRSINLINRFFPRKQ